MATKKTTETEVKTPAKAKDELIDRLKIQQRIIVQNRRDAHVVAHILKSVKEEPMTIEEWRKVLKAKLEKVKYELR